MTTVTMFAPTGVGQIILRDGTSATTAADGTVSVDSKFTADLLGAGYVLQGMRGVYSSRPLVPPTGTLYFDTTVDRLVRYDASAAVWQVVSESDRIWNEDFIGTPAAFAAAGTTSIASTLVAKIQGTAPPTALRASGSMGIANMSLTAASEKQEASLYLEDQRPFSMENRLIFEARVNMSTLTTGSGSVFIGMAGAWIDGPDNMSVSAWFAARGSGLLACETDDASTDTTASSGVTATTAQWKVLRIDARDVTNIKFYVDDVQVATSTTFAFAATGATAMMQPYIGAYKVSGTGLGVLACDYARVWGQR